MSFSWSKILNYVVGSKSNQENAWINYEIRPRQTLEMVAEDAVKVSQLNKQPVKFTFNQIKVDVGVNSKPEDLIEFYDRQHEKINLLYSMTDTLPKTITKGMDAVMEWMGNYVDLTDSAAIVDASKRNNQKVYEILEKAGYKAGADTDSDFVDNNKTSVGRYTIGQVMAAFEQNRMPKVNMTGEYIQKYKELIPKPQKII